MTVRHPFYLLGNIVFLVEITIIYWLCVYSWKRKTISCLDALWLGIVVKSVGGTTKILILTGLSSYTSGPENGSGVYVNQLLRV